MKTQSSALSLSEAPPTESWKTPGPVNSESEPATSPRTVIVSIYDSHAMVERAVLELQTAGYDMQKLSIIGSDYHAQQQVVGCYNVGGHMKYWGEFGALWSGLWDLLSGAAFFWMPGIGPLLVAGPLIRAILSGEEGARVGGGLGAVGAGLASLGIPTNSVVKYETSLKAGKHVLIGQGNEVDIAKARDTIRSTPGATQFATYQA